MISMITRELLHLKNMPRVLFLAAFSSAVCASWTLAEQPVQRNSIVKTAKTPFNTIQEAYTDQATVSTDEIQCHAGLFGEALEFNSPLDIALTGGFDAGFGANPAGITSVNSLVIGQGSATISQVALVSPVCGNGITESGEQCDDGNLMNGDGCSSTCAIESRYACTGSPSVCILTTPAVSSTTPADGATNVTLPTDITVIFDSAMNAATLSAQSSAGFCSGSIQVSADDFASCVAIASISVSNGNTVAKLTPAPALSYGTSYKVRVTSAAQNATGNAAQGYTMAAGFSTGTACEQASASHVVISQVYSGGGVSGATYLNDFVELHNAGNVAVAIGGWSVQYGSASGTGTWQVAAIPANTTIPVGGYYLIKGASGGSSGTALPTVDMTPTTLIGLGTTAGKVALVNSATALSGACPTSSAIIDLVGYGTANCSEETTAPTLSATTAALRNGLGCQDSGQNGADFTASTPTPRNSATSASICGFTANGCGTPSEVNFCIIHFPTSLNVAAGANTGFIFGRIYQAGVTEPAGAPVGVTAQVGYGPASVNPETQYGWHWFTASYTTQVDTNSDEYAGSFTAPAAGSYRYGYRFSLDGGYHWTYCDLDGAGSNGALPFDITQLPVLTVN